MEKCVTMRLSRPSLKILNGWKRQKRGLWRDMSATKSMSRRRRSVLQKGSVSMKKGTKSVLSMRQGKKNDKRNRRRGVEPMRNSSLLSSKHTHTSFKLISVSN